MSATELSAFMKQAIFERVWYVKYNTLNNAVNKFDTVARFTDARGTVRAQTDSKGSLLGNAGLITRSNIDSLKNDIRNIETHNLLSGVRTEVLGSIDKKSEARVNKLVKYILGSISYESMVKRVQNLEGATVVNTPTPYVPKSSTTSLEFFQSPDNLIVENIGVSDVSKLWKDEVASVRISSNGTFGGLSKEIVQAVKANISAVDGGHLKAILGLRLERAFSLKDLPSTLEAVIPGLNTVKYDATAQMIGESPEYTAAKATLSRQLEAMVSMIHLGDVYSSYMRHDETLLASIYKHMGSLGIHTLVEIQLSRANASSGIATTNAGKALSDLLDIIEKCDVPYGDPAFFEKKGKKLTAKAIEEKENQITKTYKRLLSTTAAIAEDIKNKAKDLPENSSEAKLIADLFTGPNSTFLEELLDAKSSRSIKEHISHVIASNLTGKPVQVVDVKAKAKDKSPGSKQNAAKLKDAANKLKAALQKVHSTVKQAQLAQLQLKRKFENISEARIASAAPQIRNRQGQFYSLASLQVLINSQLEEVIENNMGDEPWQGGQRKILNYDTGRFASTVAVERITQSRAGAITAFYSYMKYPYQTFQPGYAQGSPKSRDPRLLISKSIHEIAATKVKNRLRAVLI